MGERCQGITKCPAWDHTLFYGDCRVRARAICRAYLQNRFRWLWRSLGDATAGKAGASQPQPQPPILAAAIFLWERCRLHLSRTDARTVAAVHPKSLTRQDNRRDPQAELI